MIPWPKVGDCVGVLVVCGPASLFGMHIGRLRVCVLFTLHACHPDGPSSITPHTCAPSLKRSVLPGRTLSAARQSNMTALRVSSGY